MNTLVASRKLPVPVDNNYVQALPPDQAYQDDPRTFFIDILAALHRHWKLAVSAAFGTGLVVFLIAAALTPLYTSTATVMINTRHEQVVDLQAVLSGLPSDTFVVDSEVEVLKAPALSREIVQKLNLVQDPEFNAQLRPKTTVGIAVEFIKDQFKNFLVLIGLRDPPPPPGDILETVVANFQQNLNVKRTGLTYVITVAFSSQDRTKAAKIANAVADTYLAEQVSLKSKANTQATDFLNSRLGDLRERVQSAEREVADYKAKNGLLSAVGSTLTEQEISALNAQLATARAEQAEKEGKLRAAQAQDAAGGGEAVGEAVASDTVRALRQQQAEVLRQQADLETKYGPKHPSVRKIHQQAAQINKGITAEVDRIIGSLQADVAAARSRTASIQASIDAERRTLGQNNSATVRLAELDRNAAAVRTLYQSFLDRSKQTAEDNGLQNTDASIVSRAAPSPTTSYPPWLLVAAAAFVLASGMAGGVTVLAEMYRDGFKTPHDAENEFGLPVFASVPRIRHRDPATYVTNRPHSSFAEELRNIRTSLFYSPSDAPKVVALMSAIPGEGKTITTLALARLMATTGARVLIVDADVRRAALSRKLGHAAAPGFLDLVAGSTDLESCLKQDPLSGAQILPAGKARRQQSEMLTTQAAERVFDSLRSKFDVIFLDTAPVLPVAEPRLLARYTDAVVMLARWNWTSRIAVGDAIKLLRAVNAPVTGIALTRVDPKQQSSFGYSRRGYNYRKSYASYYIE